MGKGYRKCRKRKEIVKNEVVKSSSRDKQREMAGADGKDEGSGRR